MFVFDQPKLAEMALAVWRRGGLDTLVKVAPFGTVPDPGRPIGYCTTFKYIAGRTPAEMERVVGLKDGSKFAGGADIFTVSPLPDRSEFELKGYTQCPGGTATDAPGYVSHPIYPPGLGAPQWNLGVSQARLVWLASVPRGQVFAYPAAMLAGQRP